MLGGVGIEPGFRACFQRPVKRLERGREIARPLRGIHAGMQRREAVGRAVEGVELVRALVDHQVLVGRRRAFNRLPGQHHRPLGDGLAAEIGLAAVHHAGFIFVFLVHAKVGGIEHDAVPAVVPIQTQMQHRHAGPQRNERAHRRRNLDAGGAVEGFGVQKLGRQFAQALPVCRRKLPGVGV